MAAVGAALADAGHDRPGGVRSRPRDAASGGDRRRAARRVRGGPRRDGPRARRLRLGAQRPRPPQRAKAKKPSRDETRRAKAAERVNAAATRAADQAREQVRRAETALQTRPRASLRRPRPRPTGPRRSCGGPSPAPRAADPGPLHKIRGDGACRAGARRRRRRRAARGRHPEISDLAYDSRAVGRGTLFFCVRGHEERRARVRAAGGRGRREPRWSSSARSTSGCPRSRSRTPAPRWRRWRPPSTATRPWSCGWSGSPAPTARPPRPS